MVIIHSFNEFIVCVYKIFKIQYLQLLTLYIQ